MAQLYDRVRKECEALGRATPEQVQQEEEWVRKLMHDAEVRFRRASETIGDSVALLRQDAQDLAALQALHKARADLADAELRLGVASLIHARVGECIEARKRFFDGELWLVGTWRAACRAAEGVKPDETGRIKLHVTSSGLVKGTVYPAEGEAGVEVEGPLARNYNFSLRAAQVRGTEVEVAGWIDSSYPLRGSGTIRLGGEAVDHGKWECFGRWKSY